MLQTSNTGQSFSTWDDQMLWNPQTSTEGLLCEGTLWCQFAFYFCLFFWRFCFNSDVCVWIQMKTGPLKPLRSGHGKVWVFLGPGSNIQTGWYSFGNTRPMLAKHPKNGVKEKNPYRPLGSPSGSQTQITSPTSHSPIFYNPKGLSKTLSHLWYSWCNKSSCFWCKNLDQKTRET